MKGDDIARRLLGFAVSVLVLLNDLSEGVAAKHVARQLLRSATGGGANYEEARGAESRADFAHKVSVAAKEIREALYWLRVIHEAHLTAHHDLPALIREANQLVAILTSSAKTARQRAG